MRLSKIKLAGFKSFVDPTTILLPSDLTAVVGPNGCGKSNIIDAVRWVMGESSAKHLRGDSMADVIFNGSSARQPVGSASIELVFENTDGTVGGQYASYAEISIKRVITRDGISAYSLNGTRCRRKDIRDIFLGTGLGPRSYAIIEQGMITRLIDAKPDELRSLLEEAAGISKYKEKRRETENRIRHTRDNLSRLADLREEVDKQIAHLQRQARTAERFKRLKQEQRKVEAELLVLRLREMENRGTERKRIETEHDNRVQAALAELRRVESELERSRTEHDQRGEVFNEVQGRYYRLGAEVARIEQTIQHGRELRQQQRNELEQTGAALGDAESHLQRDRDQHSEVCAAIAEMEPAAEAASAAERDSQSALEAAEAAMQTWQDAWEAYSESSGSSAEASKVEKTSIEHLEAQLDELLKRQEALRTERGIHDPSKLEGELAELQTREETINTRLMAQQAKVDGAQARISELRERDASLAQQLDEERRTLQDARGRLASLEALQQAALGESESGSVAWLQRSGLAERPRLAEVLEVDAGWEAAVETVLGDHLEAVCVDGLDPVTDLLGDLERGSVALLDVGPTAGVRGSEGLASKVAGAGPLASVLARVRTAGSLTEALALRGRLGDGESVVTADGIWIGRDWLRVVREDPAAGGVISREREMRGLQEQRDQLTARIGDRERELDDTRLAMSELEAEREEAQADLNRLNREQAGVRAQLDAGRTRMEQTAARLQALDAESAAMEERISATDRRIRESRGRLEGALDRMQQAERERQGLLDRRDSLRTGLDNARRAAAEGRTASHGLQVSLEARRSTRDSLDQAMERLTSQLGRLQARRDELTGLLDGAADPEVEHRQSLDAALAERIKVEEELAAARAALEAVQARIRELDHSRVGAEEAVEAARSVLAEARLAGQEVRVRIETLLEQLKTTGLERAELEAELEEGASVEAWEAQHESVERRLERLGPINLAAIEEFEQQSERKAYLDAQHADLIEALETLESAIKRIDRETRTRFKETFDRVNAGLKSRFPRLFGGGHAYLELTGEDLLDAGVAIMARPPGKRNATIHQLSGGEKALTASALVFAIFDLNPAPFCMLDEVDAPLDDANVSRFCELVREMSESVQVVLITHNKATMEMAKQLMGVTMHEPGVSRLVAVDIDEAVSMASEAMAV